MYLKTRVFITKHFQPLLQAHVRRSAWVSVTTAQRHVGALCREHPQTRASAQGHTDPAQRPASRRRERARQGGQGQPVTTGRTPRTSPRALALSALGRHEHVHVPEASEHDRGNETTCHTAGASQKTPPSQNQSAGLGLEPPYGVPGLRE